MRVKEMLRGMGGGVAPLVVGLAGFSQAFDTGSVVVALPAMARDFGVPILSLNLVIMAYLVAATAFLPLCGWASDRFGARRIFLVALIGFALSSAACMMATSLGMLIAARAIEGCMGAMMLPVGRVIVLRAVPRHRVTDAFALLSMPVMLGPLLGPVIGGFIVAAGAWRWVFAINILIAVPAFWAVLRFIDPVPAENPRPLDIVGSSLIAGALVAITYAIGALADAAVSRGLIAALVGGGLGCAALYMRHARHHPAPIMQLGLLRSPVIMAANAGGMFQRMVVSAVPFLLTLLFQSSFGLDAATSGSLLFASAFGALLGRWGLPPLVARFGFRRFMLGNSLVFALLVAAAAIIGPTTPHIAIIVLLFCQGCVRAIQLIGIMTLSFAGVGDRDMGAASTITSVSQQFALSLGIALSVLALGLVQQLRGTEALVAETVSPAFVIIALLSMLSIFYYYRLPHDAGVEFTGAKA